LIEPLPATAVVTPPQLLLAPFGVETSNPPGKLSVNAIPVTLVVLVFEIVNVRLVLVFRLICPAPKAFEIVGGASTVILADAVFPVPPSVEVTALVVLFFGPAVVPVTFTVIVHDPGVAIEPPLRLIDPFPGVAVTVPLQLLVRPGVLATTSPAGKPSVNASPVNAAVFPAGSVIVNVKLVVPFNGMVAAPNDLLIDGGNRTTCVRVAEALPEKLVSPP
jgi:hypothetical protein